MTYQEVLAFTVLATCVGLASTQVNSSRSCCDNGISMKDGYTCENNKNVSVACDSIFFATLSNEESSPYQHYYISNDTEGEYLKSYAEGYIVPAPYFCEGFLRESTANVTTTKSRAVYCHNFKIYQTVEEPPTKSQLEYTFLKLYAAAVTILNGGSFVFLTITALLYFFLPEVQDTEGTCTFHFALNMGLVHGGFVYLWVFRIGLLPDFCITKLYLLMFILLAAFAWSTVSSFNMWYRLRENRRIDELKLVQRYRYVAYGVPTCLVALANIQVHVSSLYRKYGVETNCLVHAFSITTGLYLVIPIFLAMIANVIFFICVQMNLRNHLPLKYQGKNSRLRKIRYRVRIFIKSFLVFGLPYTLFIVFLFLLASNYRNSNFLANCSVIVIPLFISTEGVFIFLILVAFRCRIRKAIVRRYLPNCRFVPAQWRTEQDLETSQESCCSHEIELAKTSESHSRVISNGSA